MTRTKGLRRRSKTPFAKTVARLDIALSNLTRQHYEKLGCCTCNWFGPYKEADCGHFRRRECMSTRFDPRNVMLQCKKCNRFNGGRPYEFGREIDHIWGKGTAEKLFKKSHGTKKWEIKELEQLIGAAKQSWLAYLTLYTELTA